jgi:uncharacterized protein with HEPN domain
MQPKLLKYILDIESIISEIEIIKSKLDNNYLNFKHDFISRRAVERDLEIIGEAVKKIVEINSEIKISSSNKIIELRNIISHAYDSVEPELIWGIIQKDIPILKNEIISLKE